jgi:hypothetical protein
VTTDLSCVLVGNVELKSGGHKSRQEGVCVMELAAWLAGEEHTDHPECVSPVIGAFMRSWNDSLNDTDRQILKPYAAKVIGTSGTAKQEEKRAWMATDWLVREFTPAFLRLAGLTEHAEALEGLAPLISDARAKKAQPKISAAHSAARSAYSAARSAARSAADSAAYSAARSAARSAAGEIFAPTVKVLQTSALLLLDRMIEA